MFLEEEVVELVSSCSLSKSVGLITFKSSTYSNYVIVIRESIRKTPSAFFFKFGYVANLDPSISTGRGIRNRNFAIFVFLIVMP